MTRARGGGSVINGAFVKFALGACVALLIAGVTAAVATYGEVKDIGATVRALKDRVDRIEDKLDGKPTK